MKKPTYFQIHLEYASQFEKLTDEQAGRLIKGLSRYAETGETPDFSDDLALDVFCSLIINKMAAEFEKYGEICEKRASATKAREEKKNERNTAADNDASNRNVCAGINSDKEVISNDVSENKFQNVIELEHQMISNDIKSDQMISNDDISNQTISNHINIRSPKSKVIVENRETPPKQDLRERVREVFEIYARTFDKDLTLTAKRKALVKTLLNRKVDYVRLFEKAKMSSFLREKGLLDNFDWLVTYDNAVKILEGAYDNHAKKSNGFCFDNASHDIKKYEENYKVPESPKAGAG